MKHNLHIDFFSSPNSKFIGFSDIKQPREDINYGQEEEHTEEKRAQRKSSFSFMYEPIVPFGQDFFQEKLQECDEPESCSDQQQYEIIQEDSLLKSPIIPENLLNPRPKFPVYDGNKKIDQQRYSDMFCDIEQNKTFLQGKTPANLQEMFMTPKKKIEFLNNKRFTQTTAQKNITRNNEKGLRRLSTLAYSIVSQSSATTYKEVAEKLLSRLNFDCSELDDEQCRAQKSSMQNVKRRVYDSLNVLIALGVITRVGNKISRQKQKKNLLSGQFTDLQKYNDLLNQYKKKLINIQLKRKTQRQLKEKLSIFKKTVDRNKKTKPINKSKVIRLPFLVFATDEKHHDQEGIGNNIDWIAKMTVTQNNGQTEKKKLTGSKRNQSTAEAIPLQHSQKANDTIVQISLKEFPESYGDLDFFKLIQLQSRITSNLNLRFGGESYHHPNQGQQTLYNSHSKINSMQEFGYEESLLSNNFNHNNHQQQQIMMNSLIDQVLEY